MSKFINSCVNYSESNVLKIKLLKPLLNTFNKHLVNINSGSFKNSSVVSDIQFLIPNNNIKYYLFITNKNNITNNLKDHHHYKILYFFPETKTNHNSDFYMEIDSKIGFDKDNYLFEGYLYNKNTFLISDLLFINNNLFDLEYTLRFSLINEIIKCNLKNINGFLNIGIHQYLTSTTLLQLFINNFVFKNELKGIEYVKQNFEKINELNVIKKPNEQKIIEKTKYIEVYRVYNITSKNYEGTLYVQKLTDSKKLKSLFTKDTITVECKWNLNFNKWQFQ